MEIGYNLLFRHPETNGLLVACDELNLAPIAILPLGEGMEQNLKQVSDNLSSLQWKKTSDEFQQISKLERKLW